jgi:hypothetical protein
MASSTTRSTIDPKLGIAVIVCLVAIIILLALQGGYNAEPNIVDVKGVQVDRNGQPDSKEQRATDIEGSF